jgi:hypothetical protein
MAVPCVQADVIVPGSAATVEGNLNNGFPFSIGAGHSQRYQQVYSSTEFLTPVLISGVAFRPDGSVGGAFLSTLPNVQITLSTTGAAVDGLSPTFATNVGGNVTTVFSGALSLSSSFTGPPGGPKDFDIAIVFTTPFLYNPLQGNLLLDISNFGGGAARAFDSQSALDSTSRVFSACNANPGGICSGVGDLTGLTSTEGLVTRFSTTAIQAPEASSVVLLGLGLTVLLLAFSKWFGKTSLS